MIKHTKYITIFLCILLSVSLSAGDRTAKDHLIELTSLQDSLNWYQDKNPEEALPFYYQSYETYQNNDEFGFETAYMMSAYYFHTLSVLDSTKKYAMRALEIAQSLNDPALTAKAYNVLASVNLQQGNFDEALNLFAGALEISHALNNLELEATILMNTGSVYSYKGEYLKAVDYYTRARHIFRSLNDTNGEIACMNNLVVFYVQFKQYDQAKIHQKTINNHFLKSESLPRILAGSTNMGVIHFYLEEYDSALYYFNNVLDLCREYNNANLYANILNNIAETHIKLGNLDVAREQALESYNLCLSQNNIYGQASALKNLGLIAFTNKDYEQAKSYLEKSLPLAREVNAITELDDILSALIQIYEQQNMYKKAYEALKEYSSIIESANREETLFRLEEMQLQYENERNKAELLEKMTNVRREKQIRNMLLVIVAFMLVLITILAVANRSRKVYLKILKNKNDIIKKDHELLLYQQNHLSLINKILRHDLANNNTAIISAIKLFKRQSDNQYLNAVTKKAETSLELIERMKELESLTAPDSTLKSMNVRNIIRRTLLQYPSIDFSIHGNGHVIADEALHSIFDNIIHNALIHGEATKIEISIEPCSGQGDKMVEIRIDNNGSKIPEDIKEKIFSENFSYGSKAHTGLGLYIVRKNIDRYNGKIRVENIPSGGVSMIIHLPPGESK